MPDEHHEQEKTQEAVDATSTAYAADADLDVEQRFRDEMQRRGFTVTDDAWVTELAHHIRSGHPVIVGS